MYHRKAVFTAVAGVLASSGLALADGVDAQAPKLSLNPSVVSADAAPAETVNLMSALDKAGVGKSLQDAGVNIYGWVETGYTLNHRHFHNSFVSSDGGDRGNGIILPGPFTHEYGNHLMLNQFVLRLEKQVDASKGKFDVGGLLELMYGSDAGRIHSGGLGYNGSDPSDDGNPGDSPDSLANLHPILQFDIPQAYLDVAVPVGTGLSLRIGKFVTHLSTETIDPRGNAFYSHSWLFNLVPFTHTGIEARYQLNEQLQVMGGISRGWDVATEDNNGAIDALFQFVYTPNKEWTFMLCGTTGPENGQFGSGNPHDSSHWRTALNPMATWKVTDKLTLGLEALYVYDGGVNHEESGSSHAYGDAWGAAAYVSYIINDMLTANVRLEKAHMYTEVGPLGDMSDVLGIDPAVPTINVYGLTLGVTIKPFTDPIGKNLTVRPEIRWDHSEDPIFVNGTGDGHKSQFTVGADVIFTF